MPKEFSVGEQAIITLGLVKPPPGEPPQGTIALNAHADRAAIQSGSSVPPS